MSLMEHRPEGQLAVRAVRPDAIVVGGRELSRSFLLAPEALQPEWRPDSLDAIDAAAVEEILALNPAVVLLGTGARQRLPSPALLGAFLTRGVGLEAMDNAAAARTFNLLAAEGRRVVAAFLLPG